MASGAGYRSLAEEAWAWVLAQVRDDDGPWLPEVVTDDAVASPAADRDSLYAGIAGLAPVLAEIRLTRPLAAAEEQLAEGIVRRLGSVAPGRVEPSLYDGLAGDVTALRMLAPGSERAALQRLTDLMTADGWPTTLDMEPGSTAPLTDVVLGTAGIVMAAVWAGGPLSAAIAQTGGEALLRAARPTPTGLDWRITPGSASSTPNYSHGTAGVGAALAVAGEALQRNDFVAAAVSGAWYLLEVARLEDDGFVVPHTLPYSTREVEPVTYSWCHGPAGTSHLFTALSRAHVGSVDGHDVADLRRRCLRSILTSGLPQRLRPGFWDNDGRCCGTAGVGDVLLDAAQDSCDGDAARSLVGSAVVMADAVVDRAVRDADGARWRFVEYRIESPLLPPNTSWMQGTAGIAAYLFRLARVLDDGLDAPVVDRPDAWWSVPAALRVSGRASPVRPA